MKTIRINASKSYDVIIDTHILDSADIYILSVFSGTSIYIVTDDIVDELYSKRLEKALEKHYSIHKYVIPNGEKSKNPDVYIKILSDMAKKGITRKDAVLAFGGGVVGDLAGFVAATYQRGIGLIQMPTTLLACVDSSVGGKTGIDLGKEKNFAGAFYQPDLVICDLSLLDTLPEHVFRDGVAEVIKYGILAGHPVYTNIKDIRENILQTVFDCVNIKKEIVQKDESDNGIRQLLNLGHTIGHAIEHLSDFEISHGHSVAKGISMIAKISYNMGLCSKETKTEIEEILKNSGFDTHHVFSVHELHGTVKSDKKRSGDSINMILIKNIGTCLIQSIKIDELFTLIDNAITLTEDL